MNVRQALSSENDFWAPDGDVYLTKKIIKDYDNQVKQKQVKPLKQESAEVRISKKIR